MHSNIADGVMGSVAVVVLQETHTSFGDIILALYSLVSPMHAYMV